MIVEAIFILILAIFAASCAYWLVALLCLRRVLRSAAPTDFRPSVAVLKPVKGIDSNALENYISFCQQDYPDFEILFGVSSAKDPAVPVINDFKRRFPNHPIRLIVAPPLGSNPKAGILNTLAAETHADVLVISDSDIRVTPDYLRRAVGPLEQPEVGLVTCLYRGESPRSLMACLASLHMDTTFAASAAIGWRMGTDVGLGATLAMRRSDLERIGGYTAIADHLLDDNEIAVRIARLGLKVVLSDCVVASVLGRTRFREQWRREVRWARGIRTAYPLRYPGLLLTFTLLLAHFVAAFTGVWSWAWYAIPLALALRWLVGWQSARLLGQPRRAYLALMPVRDWLSVAVWCAGVFGRRVHWRGVDFLLRPDGRLVNMSETQPLPSGLLAGIFRRVDAHLRKKQGIFEFTDDPECAVRMSVEPAAYDVNLSDGTRVKKGDRVGVIHFWNDHLTRMPAEGPDLTWAIAMRRQLVHSFRLLAAAAQTDPRLMDLPLFGGTAVFASREGEKTVDRVVSRFGFEWVEVPPRNSLFQRLHDFGENFLFWGLMRAFNPGGLRGKKFVRPREPLWMSRKTLLAKYGQAVGQQPKPITRQAAIEDR
ncbi:MAG TPA: bacteriohopanetetrol glucosamine biosynthesis glycosyltransferase HpnI [Tepidisphaeraceae bacterium]|nr:bacteriohopanetetrol glucosamine biosynthesis glycosyltransferase HpnI [Tepidisphaeraceae bacterium]